MTDNKIRGIGADEEVCKNCKWLQLPFSSEWHVGRDPKKPYCTMFNGSTLLDGAFCPKFERNPEIPTSGDLLMEYLESNDIEV